MSQLPHTLYLRMQFADREFSSPYNQLCPFRNHYNNPWLDSHNLFSKALMCVLSVPNMPSCYKLYIPPICFLATIIFANHFIAIDSASITIFKVLFKRALLGRYNLTGDKSLRLLLYSPHLWFTSCASLAIYFSSLLDNFKACSKLLYNHFVDAPICMLTCVA